MIMEVLSPGRTIDQLPADFLYLEEQDVGEELALAAVWPRGMTSDRKLMRVRIEIAR